MKNGLELTSVVSTRFFFGDLVALKNRWSKIGVVFLFKKYAKSMRV
jgi:hypothetical protein